MISIDSKSYPYLAVAQATTYEYGFLLNTKTLEEIQDMQKNMIALGASLGIDYDKVKNVYGIEVWNAAIEKAAEVAILEYSSAEVSEEIRKLKV